MKKWSRQSFPALTFLSFVVRKIRTLTLLTSSSKVFLTQIQCFLMTRNMLVQESTTDSLEAANLLYASMADRLHMAALPHVRFTTIAS